MIQLGIFAKTFIRPTMAEALDAVVESGLRSVQFNMALATGTSLPPRIAPEQAGAVDQALAIRGLEMAAVSGTYNMAHPDRRTRTEGAAGLATLIEAAPSLGTEVVTLCTGSRDAGNMWRAHPDNRTPEAWADMRASLAAALAVAESAGVTLAIEPEPGNVVADAVLARRLLDELSTPHLRVVFDAANLVAPSALDEQASTLRQALELLAPEVVIAHAKDVRRDGLIVAACHGDLDYAGYLGLLEEFEVGGPLILHGLDELEVADSVSRLAGLLPTRR